MTRKILAAGTLAFLFLFTAVVEVEAARSKRTRRTTSNIKGTTLQQLDLHIGVQSGPAFYDVDAPQGSGNTNVGPAVSAIVEARIWRFVHGQFEFAYVEKGTGAATGDYLEFPLLGKLKPQRTYYGFRPYFMTGPNLGVLIGTTGVNSGVLEDVDFSWDVGAGVEREIWNGLKGFFSMKGSMGIMSISNNSNVDATNMGFQMLIGASYPLNRLM